MNKKNAAVLSIFVIIAAMISMVAVVQDNDTVAHGDVKITRHVTEEEARNAQIKILDLRALQGKIESGVLGAAELVEINRQIGSLMPILDKYQEQEHAKHYIEPTRLAYLERAEEEIRDYLATMGFESYGVNLNTLTKIMEIVTDDSSKNAQIEAFVSRYTDMPFEIANGPIILIDQACAAQTDDCDPVVGGVEIEGGCTFGLPVRKGSWPLYTYGFITAGHCLDDSEVMNQPNKRSPKIGNKTDSHYTNDCDCTWSAKDTVTPSKSAIWRSPNNYLTIYNESDDLPVKGDMVVLSGKTSGFKMGQIVDGSFKMRAGGVDWDLISHDIKTGGGDSGAPIGDADASHIIGIHKGKITKKDGSVHYVATAWKNIDKYFSVDLH